MTDYYEWPFAPNGQHWADDVEWASCDEDGTPTPEVVPAEFYLATDRTGMHDPVVLRLTNDRRTLTTMYVPVGARPRMPSAKPGSAWERALERARANA